MTAATVLTIFRSEPTYFRVYKSDENETVYCSTTIEATN